MVKHFSRNEIVTLVYHAQTRHKYNPQTTQVIRLPPSRRKEICVPPKRNYNNFSIYPDISFLVVYLERWEFMGDTEGKVALIGYCEETNTVYIGEYDPKSKA